MGVYRSGSTHRIRFSRFGMRPSSFKAARNKKPLKNRHFYRIFVLFERFLGSSRLKPWWSHSRPRKSNSVGSSGSIDPNGHLGGVLIAEISSVIMFVLIFLCLERPLVNILIVKMMHGVHCIDINIKITYFCKFWEEKSKITLSIKSFTRYFERNQLHFDHSED